VRLDCKGLIQTPRIEEFFVFEDDHIQVIVDWKVARRLFDSTNHVRICTLINGTTRPGGPRYLPIRYKQAPK